MESPTDQFKRPEAKNNKYRFFCTGNHNLLLKGIDIDLDMNYDPIQCQNYLKGQLKGKIDNLNSLDLLIYLPGGIPFLGGTLNDIYPKGTGPDVKPYIYGIVTRPVPDKKLNENILELCNCKDEIHKILLSPICNSTPTGLCDMACLLSYLSHDGVLWDKFLKCSSAVIHFPPFIASLNRLCERNYFTGRDIITITSTLHTYLKYLITPSKPTDQLFEHLLRCCNYIININNDNDKFPMKCAELKSDDPSASFLIKLKQPKTVYFWEGDTVDEYVYYTLQPLNINSNDDIEENGFLSFTPIAPLSIRVVTGCSIVRGKDHNYFYIQQSAEKGTKNQNNVDIIDPFDGKANSIDLDDFARNQENTRMDSSASLIDQDRVKQVIFVCFDQSGSMKRALDGKKVEVTEDTQTRAIIATQYLTSFANKTYGYRIPCIQGLIRFNNEIKISCPLSPLVPDFEEYGLNNLRPCNQTMLWDAISTACDELIKFTKTSNGNKRFKNSVNRILVISDGEDTGSKMKLVDVSKKMLENKIIVDCVLVSKKEKCKELVTLCHITGGLAFNPQSTNEGILLFEKSAFLNYDERNENSNPLIGEDRKTRPRALKSSMINAEFIEKAVKCAKFDDCKEIPNKIFQRATGESRLASPRHICSVNLHTPIQQPRRRRILRELHYAALVMDKEQKDRYDSGIIVYPFASCLDVWQVYLKGEDKTPYEGKWFYLLATFPDLYPIECPIFRFISIPYNLNVSSEGRICLNVIEKGYLPCLHVIDILQQIKELFVIPSMETPVQIEIMETFNEDPEKYNRLARQSAMNVGKDDFKQFLPQRVTIQDDVKDGFESMFSHDNVPAYMVSQISGRVIKDPVLASSGVYYEREELKQLILEHRNPICVITGKKLTEKAEDFDDVIG